MNLHHIRQGLLTGVLGLAAAWASAQGVGAVAPAVAASAPWLEITAARVVSHDKSRSRLLTSSGGDIELVLTPKSARLAQDHLAAFPDEGPIQLYLNRVNVTAQASPVGVLSSNDAQPVLRFELQPGGAMQTFYAAQYREHGLKAVGDLRVELGWPATGPHSVGVPKPLVLQVAVAPDYRVAVAACLLGGLGFLMVVLLRATDTFRDGAPAWLEIARRWEVEYRLGGDVRRREILARIIGNQSAPDEGRQKEVMRRVDDGLPVNGPVPDTAAGGGATRIEPSDEEVAYALLNQGQGSRPLPRPAYSLGRLQLGVWFGFAIAAGLLLWVVYGQLPALTGSLLALLGISVGTAAATKAADPRTASVSSNASRNLFLDVVTGYNQAQQVHRYQAVVVNLLLLVVAWRALYLQLTMPVFDETWLVFLGVSGAALAAGKQVIEGTPSST